MITIGALMLLGLVVLMGVLFAMFPTPPPEASIAGPEAEARAMAAQSRLAAATAGLCAVLLLLLTRFRTATFDFNARTLRIQDVRALIIWTSRTIPFSDIKEAEIHSRLIGTYLGWVLRIHRRSGGSVLLGPWAPDPGLPILAARLPKA